MTITNDLEEEYADVLEIGKRLGIHLESARRLARQGKLPVAFRSGNKWLMERDRLDQSVSIHTRRRKISVSGDCGMRTLHGAGRMHQ